MKKPIVPIVLFTLFLSLGAAMAQEAQQADAAVIQADNLSELQAKVGAEVIVEGVVKEVSKAPGDNITFLNFGQRKSGFVVVVFRSSYDKFPEGLEKFANQKVRVRGTLESYKDRQVQIRVSTPDQLEIVASES